MNNRLLRRRAELDILRHAWSIHAVHYAFNRFASPSRHPSGEKPPDTAPSVEKKSYIAKK